MSSPKNLLLLLCFLVPLLGCEPSSVTSLVRIKRATPNPKSPHRESEAEYKTYKETQETLMTSPFVLNAALRKNRIEQLTILKQEQDPLSWLEDNLTVYSPGDSEIIAIKLSSIHTNDAMKVVDAVVEAYMYEIARSEKTERSRQLQTLQTQRRCNEQLIKEKTEIIDRLSKQFGAKPGKSQAVLERKAYLIEREILSISKSARDLRLARITARKETVTQLDAKLALLEDEKSKLTKSHDVLLQSMEEPKAFSGDLATKRLELDNSIAANRELATRINELQLDLLQENRIQRVQPATTKQSGIASISD